MNGLYRKSSVEKLSNPEQLDKAITISSPLSWLALIGVLIVIAAVIIWSFFGILPTTVTVNGIIAEATDAGSVFTDNSGIVTKVLKKAGDNVISGDKIAVITTSDGTEKTIEMPDSGVISTVLVTENEPVYIGDELFRYTPAFGQDHLVVCYVPSQDAGQLHKDMKVLLYPSSVDTRKTGHMEAVIDTVGKYSANTINMGYVLGANNLVSEQFLSTGPVVAVVCRIKTDPSTKSGYWWSNDNGKDVMVSEGTFLSARILVDESAPITKLFNGFKDKMEG